MNRNIYTELTTWKESKNRKPLILLGARQVGKTYILKQLGEKGFDDFLYVNCHNNPIMENIFSDFDIDRIVRHLEQAYEHKITDGKTLLFFDEIQEIKNGIPSLKYFCELRRNLHVVVAGSLLGITLREDESYPVGKVTTMRMYPMTFDEFLQANKRDMLASAVRNLDWDSMALNDKTLSDYLRQYYFTGGMPEAVITWINSHDTKEVRNIQNEILSAYVRDMGKHTKSQAIRINQIWNCIPSQLAKENKKFIFGAIKKGARSADYELAIQWLVNAGLIYKIERISKTAEPLKMYADPSIFKIYLLDHGLLAALAGTRASEMLIDNSVFTEFKGAFTENFILTQIKVLEKKDSIENSIFYFSKDNSTQEVDFIVQCPGRIVPIEVKAESNVQAKSLKQFISDNPNLKGIRCSMRQYVDQGWMENIPLYATEAYFNQLSQESGTDLQRLQF